MISDVGIEPPEAALVTDPGPTAAQLWAAHQASAQAALDFNDRVAIRCLKAGVSYPAEWRNHDNALRAILRAASGDPTLPTPPHPLNSRLEPDQRQPKPRPPRGLFSFPIGPPLAGLFRSERPL